MEDKNTTKPQPPRYGWVTCEACGGNGTTPYFRGTSLTINHLARGGDPTKLPCGECHGDGRNWTVLNEDTKGKRNR